MSSVAKENRLLLRQARNYHSDLQREQQALHRQLRKLTAQNTALEEINERLEMQRRGNIELQAINDREIAEGRERLRVIDERLRELNEDLHQVELSE